MPKPVNANFHLTDTASIQDEIITFDVLINETRLSRKDYNKYRDFFLRIPPNVIKKTFEATTQFARAGWITGHITNTIKAPFPTMNVVRRNESVATDTMFADTTAVDNCSTCAQNFCWHKFQILFGNKNEYRFGICPRVTRYNPKIWCYGPIGHRRWEDPHFTKSTGRTSASLYQKLEYRTPLSAPKCGRTQI